ncbi:MAG TPA: aldo/keto reductase [Candidatus Binataceae bacterium]|nr:aldo/keto reductase [Candidatus Binataceae bacterium]
MLKGRATAEATTTYANRFASLPGNYRPALGLSISSIGIGTYLGEPDEDTDRSYEESITAALRGGINLVDTAVNYRFQRSERNIGKAIAAMAAAGEIRREEIVIATKGGYITFDGEVPPNPRAWFEEKFIRTGIVSPGDLVDGSHCMTPRYIGAMLEMSRANLGLETIDIYYLHNPESQLEAIDRKEFLQRIRSAFEFLEQAAAAGKIGVYGAATWNGFRAAPTERGWLSLDDLVRIAREVAGDSHRFRAIQLPYNLAMPEAVGHATQIVNGQKMTALAGAQSLGIAVCASASLLQGQLSRRLPPIVADAFNGFTSDAQRAIQFVRSTPGVNVALVGMKSAEHVRDALAAAAIPPAPLEDLMKLFKRSDEA